MEGRVVRRVSSKPADPIRIGRYEIAGRLATGGMAEILLARTSGPSGFDRPCVIKRILPHLAAERTFREMFLDEARIVANIRHRNVVQVTELGEEEGELYLVMEYLEGESLAGLLRRLAARSELLATDLAAYIVSEAAAGLHAAHELRRADGTPQELVHRDISPQNIFVGYDGSVKVLDFGVAKAADRMTATEVGQLKGKLEYMSPEQVHSRPLDRRSDVFALGIVLFEASTARRLFRRESKVQALKAVASAVVPTPSSLVPGYPGRLEAIVMRALARAPADRHQTAAELRRELAPIANERSEPPDERLGALMRNLFGERIGEKEEMLRRVQAGSDLTGLPAADVDVEVELASAVVEARGPTMTHTGLTAVRARWQWGVGVLVLGALTATLSWAFARAYQHGAASDPLPRAAVVPGPGPAPLEPRPSEVSETAHPAVPVEIVLEFHARPPGTSVFLDDVLLGQTDESGQFLVRRPPDGDEHEIRFATSGHSSVTLSTHLDRSTVFHEVTLAPARTPPVRVRRRHPTEAAPAVEGAAAPAPAAPGGEYTRM